MTMTERLRPLMPKATAIWLVENTTLTFRQIADSCGLHILEVQALADQEVESTLRGQNPILSGQLTASEIKRCEEDENSVLTFQDPIAMLLPKQKKERRYMPRAYRQDRPDAIAWVIKHYPKLSDNKICALLSTTPKTVQAIRQKTHVRTPHLKPRHPVLLGICTEKQLHDATYMLEKNEFVED